MQMSHCTMLTGSVAPSKGFVGRNTVETAVALAVASFNDGAKACRLWFARTNFACIMQLIRVLSFVNK